MAKNNELLEALNVLEEEKNISKDTLLGAMMTCNGCKSANPKEPDVDEGILEKIDRLVSEELKVMHVGACRLYGL